MKSNAEIKSFIKEQLSGIRPEDDKEFQAKVIAAIYQYLEKMGHERHAIKLMIDEIIVEKLKALVKKLKDLGDK